MCSKTRAWDQRTTCHIDSYWLVVNCLHGGNLMHSSQYSNLLKLNPNWLAHLSLRWALKIRRNGHSLGHKSSSRSPTLMAKPLHCAVLIRKNTLTKTKRLILKPINWFQLKLLCKKQPAKRLAFISNLINCSCKKKLITLNYMANKNNKPKFTWIRYN